MNNDCDLMYGAHYLYGAHCMVLIVGCDQGNE